MKSEDPDYLEIIPISEDDKCQKCPSRELSTCPKVQYKVWLLQAVRLAHQNVLKDTIKIEVLEEMVLEAVANSWHPKFVLAGTVFIQESNNPLCKGII